MPNEHIDIDLSDLHEDTLVVSQSEADRLAKRRAILDQVLTLDKDGNMPDRTITKVFKAEQIPVMESWMRRIMEIFQGKGDVFKLLEERISMPMPEDGLTQDQILFLFYWASVLTHKQTNPGYAEFFASPEPVMNIEKAMRPHLVMSFPPSPISDAPYLEMRSQLLDPQPKGRVTNVWTTKRKGRRVVKLDLSTVMMDIKQLLPKGIDRTWDRGVDIYYMERGVAEAKVFKTKLHAMYNLVVANGKQVPATMAERCAFVQKMLDAA